MNKKKIFRDKISIFVIISICLLVSIISTVKGFSKVREYINIAVYVQTGYEIQENSKEVAEEILKNNKYTGDEEIYFETGLSNDTEKMDEITDTVDRLARKSISYLGMPLVLSLVCYVLLLIEFNKIAEKDNSNAKEN